MGLLKKRMPANVTSIKLTKKLEQQIYEKKKVIFIIQMGSSERRINE